MLISGRGKGFCGGYDLSILAENGGVDTGVRDPAEGAVVQARASAVVQARNHNPFGHRDPMFDYAMMSRYNRGFAGLPHADRPPWRIARVLRSRRHGYRAVLRPDHLRR